MGLEDEVLSPGRDLSEGKASTSSVLRPRPQVEARSTPIRNQGVEDPFYSDSTTLRDIWEVSQGDVMGFSCFQPCVTTMRCRLLGVEGETDFEM